MLTVPASSLIVRILFPSLHCFRSVGKTPCSAEPGFELGPAVQQASTLPTELCCTLHCYGGFKDFRNFPVIYCMKKVKCECGVGSNLQSLAPLAANYPLSHCCIAYYRKKLKFRGPKKSRFLGPSPLKCPSLWIVPPQNHFVPAHINTRYINS